METFIQVSLLLIFVFSLFMGSMSLAGHEYKLAIPYILLTIAIVAIMKLHLKYYIKNKDK